MKDIATVPNNRLVLIAAIGNSVLALPGLYGALVASERVTFYWQRALGDSQHVGRALLETAFFTILIGFGLVLVASYWLIHLGWIRGRMRRLFWHTSAGYNALLCLSYGALIVWMMPDVGQRAPDRLLTAAALLLACWTGFMAWLSIRQARAG